MESRLLRIGWIVMLIVGALCFFLGLYFIADPVSLMEPKFEQMAGQSWADFVAANPTATVDYIQMEKRLLGIAQVAMAVFVVMVTLFAYRKGQRWSWYSLLAAGVIYWAGFLIHFMVTTGDLKPPPIIALVLLVIALALPAKNILTQKSS